jgi:hypothetical protein
MKYRTGIVDNAAMNIMDECDWGTFQKACRGRVKKAVNAIAWMAMMRCSLLQRRLS